MFDPDRHEIDPETGFHVNKETGHPVGLVPAPLPLVAADREWPKWVPVHDSQIVRKEADGLPANVSTPEWPECHVNRVDGTVTVLVHNEDEEARATSVLQEPKVDELEQERTAIDEKIADDQETLKADEVLRREYETDAA